jgi:hypothetical protein
MTTVGDFVVSAGQRVPFVLTYAPSHLPFPAPVDAEDALRSTEEFWRSWVNSYRSATAHAEIITTYRGHRRRADHLAAGATGRVAQLALPLLLAARRHADAPGSDEHGIL